MSSEYGGRERPTGSFLDGLHGGVVAWACITSWSLSMASEAHFSELWWSRCAVTSSRKTQALRSLRELVVERLTGDPGGAMSVLTGSLTAGSASGPGAVRLPSFSRASMAEPFVSFLRRLWVSHQLRRNYLPKTTCRLCNRPLSVSHILLTAHAKALVSSDVTAHFTIDFAPCDAGRAFPTRAVVTVVPVRVISETRRSSCVPTSAGRSGSHHHC